MNAFARVSYGAMLLLALGVGYFEWQVLEPQRAQLAMLRAEDVRFTKQVAQAQANADATERDLAAVRQDLAAWRARAAQLAGGPESTAVLSSWFARTRQLQQLFAQNPAQRIPELKLLTDRDWLRATITADLSSVEGQRRALGAARGIAKGIFVRTLSAALRSYELAHQGMLPADIFQLVPSFDSPPDPAMLQRYRLILSGSARDLGPTPTVIEETGLVDEPYDSRYRIFTGGFGSMSAANTPEPEFYLAMYKAVDAYMKAHGGSLGTDPDPDPKQLLPYFDPPLSAEQQKKYLDLEQKIADENK
jgi:hypothetical protein